MEAVNIKTSSLYDKFGQLGVTKSLYAGSLYSQWRCSW